jgi:hypothetical protein
MYIGVYFLLSGIFIVICIYLFPSIRRKLGLYIGLSLLAIIALLVTFELGSQYLNIITISEPAAFNFPGDYLDSGIIGWFVLLLPLIGILSPILISILLRKKDGKLSRSKTMIEQTTPLSSSNRRRVIEIILAIIGVLNCIIVAVIFSYYIISQSDGNISALWSLQGFYIFEIILFGVLGLIAVLKSSLEINNFWSGIPWISSGFLLVFVIIGAWTIGFFIIPAMISFLLLGILIDRRLKGDLALHLIYFVSAAIAQAVFFFLTI